MNQTKLVSGADESIYGYMGFVKLMLGDQVLWTQYTGVDRMNKTEAELDANVMEINILDINKI